MSSFDDFGLDLESDQVCQGHLVHLATDTLHHIARKYRTLSTLNILKSRFGEVAAFQGRDNLDTAYAVVFTKCRREESFFKDRLKLAIEKDCLARVEMIDDQTERGFLSSAPPLELNPLYENAVIRLFTKLETLGAANILEQAISRIIDEDARTRPDTPLSTLRTRLTP